MTTTKKRGRGQPPKLTPAVRKQICDAISIGATQKMAAAYAKVSERVFYLWMERGQAEHERLEADPEAEVSPEEFEFLQLFQSVRHAKAVSGVTWIDILNQAAVKDPRWAQYLLEKRFPDDFGPSRQVIEHTGPQGGPIQTEDVTKEDRIARIAMLMAQARERMPKQDAEADTQP